MPKVLSGAELVSFIKVRQAKQVRRLKQADGILPRLAIVMTEQPAAVIETYVRLKQAYGSDVGIDVVVERCNDEQMIDVITRLNNDQSIHAIVVQLPLTDISRTDEIINYVVPHKDVDGLGEKADYISATAEAIDWLLAGYGVELTNKKITLVGQGRLVGGPLSKMWRTRGLDVTILDKDSVDIATQLKQSDVIVSATGQPGLIVNEMVSAGAVVVDAGTASEEGKIVGDTVNDLHQRQDISITPKKGGVGPLTVAMMFDHVIRAADKVAKQVDS